MQWIIPILAMVLVISVSSVLSTFAQEPIPTFRQIVITDNAFQGTNSGDPTGISTQAFLKWKQVFQDGTEQGTTEPLSTIFRAVQDPRIPLSFVREDQPLRTLLEAQVIAVIDVSGIGSERCYEIANWNIQQTLFVNGKIVPSAKSRIIPQGLDEGTGLFEQAGLTFAPNFIKRFLELQGITLKTGDKVIWKVDASYRFSSWEGKIFIPDPEFRKETKCEATTTTQIEGFGFGFTTQMTFTWVDPTVFVGVRPTTTESDLDGDGIPDSIDQCDFQPERFNGFQDEDGCPDDDPVGFIQPIFPDTDGDGILDIDDLCPTQGEIFNGIEDTDGCPDGATLPQGFGSVLPFLTQERQEEIGIVGGVVESFTTATGEPVPFITEEQLTQIFTTASQTIEDQTQPTPTGDIDLLEGDPESPLHTDQEPIVITGVNEECNPITQDCDSIIFEAVRDFEQRVGIQLPFEPTLLNIILITGIIVGVILIVMRLTKKI